MFSILIPTWNNLAHLRLCVDSIRAHSALPHQLIVHVNDGSDGTLAWVREQGIAHTASAEQHRHLLRHERDRRCCATHDQLVYLNDDMYCLPGWDTRARRHAPKRCRATCTSFPER